MSVLVFGGAGYVGSELVEQMLASGERGIAVFDRQPPKTAHEGVRYVMGDIRDPGAVKDTLGVVAPSVVVHLAALHYIPYCEQHPAETHDVNVEGTDTIASAVKEIVPDSRFIFASSAAVYGSTSHPAKESDPVDPLDVYGRTKVAGEEIVTALLGQPIIARFFNVYGKVDPHDHLLPRVSRSIEALQPKVTLGNATSRRDFVHVSDVARGLLTLSAHTDATGHIFNIGSGVSYSVKEVVDELLAVRGSTAEVEYGDSEVARPVDAPFLQADIQKIRNVTGWRPTVPLEEGLKGVK